MTNNFGTSTETTSMKQYYSTLNSKVEVTLSEKTINDLNMLIDRLTDKMYWRFNNNNKKEDKNDTWPRTPIK